MSVKKVSEIIKIGEIKYTNKLILILQNIFDLVYYEVNKSVNPTTSDNLYDPSIKLSNLSNVDVSINSYYENL